jgi:hypothetical protein
MVKKRFAQNSGGYFLETTTVILGSIHNTRTYAARPTREFALLAAGWNMCMCPSLSGVDRLQKQNGQDRFELDI